MEKTSSIIITKWRDIPFEEISSNHYDTDHYTFNEVKEDCERIRGKEIKVYVPPGDPSNRMCDQPLYQRVDKPYMWLCSCLIEIGD